MAIYSGWLLPPLVWSTTERELLGKTQLLHLLDRRRSGGGADCSLHLLLELKGRPPHQQSDIGCCAWLIDVQGTYLFIYQWMVVIQVVPSSQVKHEWEICISMGMHWNRRQRGCVLIDSHAACWERTIERYPEKEKARYWWQNNKREIIARRRPRYSIQTLRRRRRMLLLDGTGCNDSLSSLPAPPVHGRSQRQLVSTTIFLRRFLRILIILYWIVDWIEEKQLKGDTLVYTTHWEAIYSMSLSITIKLNISRWGSRRWWVIEGEYCAWEANKSSPCGHHHHRECWSSDLQSL